MCRENSLQWCFGLKLDFVSKKNTPNSQKRIRCIGGVGFFSEERTFFRALH